MADLKSFAEQLVNLTVKEVNELAQILKDEYGIEPAAAAVAVADVRCQVKEELGLDGRIVDFLGVYDFTRFNQVEHTRCRSRHFGLITRLP